MTIVFPIFASAPELVFTQSGILIFLNMKRFLFIILALTISCSVAAQTRSSHSISTTSLFGLEYGYEFRPSASFGLNARAGATGRVVTPALGDLTFSFPSASLTIEPRYYTTETASRFLAARVNSTVGLGETTLDVSVVPVYGLRENWGKHFFGEVTAGTGLAYNTGSGGFLYYKIHLMARIGFSFGR